MKKKIGIVTITNSGLNFGNRLQNLALQEVLESFDFSVETILSSNVLGNSLLLSKLRRMAKRLLKRDLRSKHYRDFDRNYIRFHKRIRYGQLNTKKLQDSFDLLIAGSDQLWNPHFHFNSDFEFLVFADQEKRVSYAASFGVEHLSKKDEENYRCWLSKMKYLSVREEAGQQLIYSLTKRAAYLHIDPTMLMTKEQYCLIEKKPAQFLPQNYMLLYFLGEQKQEYLCLIKEYAKEMKLSVVELSETVNSTYYENGPLEFLYFLHHASYICTDSFHGTVFSILFEKEFLVFNRSGNDENMNSRINTLLNTFKLENRVFNDSTVKQKGKEKIDYTLISSLLTNKRKEAFVYFKELKDYSQQIGV